MKKKATIKVQIMPLPHNQTNDDLYIVQIQYVEGGAIFTSNKNGKGYSLNEAQHLAFTMRDNVANAE